MSIGPKTQSPKPGVARLLTGPQVWRSSFPIPNSRFWTRSGAALLLPVFSPLARRENRKEERWFLGVVSQGRPVKTRSGPTLGYYQVIPTGFRCGSLVPNSPLARLGKSKTPANTRLARWHASKYPLGGEKNIAFNRDNYAICRGCNTQKSPPTLTCRGCRCCRG